MPYLLALVIRVEFGHADVLALLPLLLRLNVYLSDACLDLHVRLGEIAEDLVHWNGARVDERVRRQDYVPLAIQIALAVLLNRRFELVGRVVGAANELDGLLRLSHVVLCDVVALTKHVVD